MQTVGDLLAWIMAATMIFNSVEKFANSTAAREITAGARRIGGAFLVALYLWSFWWIHTS